MTDETAFRADCAHIHAAWHACAKAGDAGGLLALYAEDATLESPLVPMVLPDADGGIVRGRAEIRRFLAAGARLLTRRLTHWHRDEAWATDGVRLLVWEYPRETPDGQQLDIVEVMELVRGKIQRHRIYWGWHGTGLLAAHARGEQAFS
jgi:steroid Delta-isomerase